MMRRLPVCVLMTAGLWAAAAWTQPVTTGVLWLGGDVHLGMKPAPVLAPLRALLGDAPGFVNLEGPVTSVAPATSKHLRLSNAPDALSLLKASGVVAVGMSNNHAADAGEHSVENTVSAVGKAGLQPAGMGHVARLNVGNVRVVITAHDLGNGVPPGLLAELQAARVDGDVLISTFHVTTEPSYLPPRELKAAVDIALRAGASLVAGHGSHQLGPVEKRGNQVVAYGLGNLAFACDCTHETDAILLRLTLSDHRLTSTEVVPIRAGLHGQPATPAPRPLEILALLQALGSRGMTIEGDVGRIPSLP